jgi:hypothetical protein
VQTRTLNFSLDKFWITLITDHDLPVRSDSFSDLGSVLRKTRCKISFSISWNISIDGLSHNASSLASCPFSKAKPEAPGPYMISSFMRVF